MPTLYIVATPIGNLKDITLRGLQTLKEVDFILCEDTRVTRKLLTYYEINKPFISYHQHSQLTKVNYIFDLLKQGKNLALVSDAGTPGISDPGNKLIQEISVVFGNRVAIMPIPGPSALTAVLSIAGFATDKFCFFGFPPLKNKRKIFFEEINASKKPVIFYESPYRILKTLNELKILLGARRIVIGHELTKKFEAIYRGTAEELFQKFVLLKKEDKRKLAGEFTIIVEGKRLPEE